MVDDGFRIAARYFLAAILNLRQHVRTARYVRTVYPMADCSSSFLSTKYIPQSAKIAYKERFKMDPSVFFNFYLEAYL